MGETLRLAVDVPTLLANATPAALAAATAGVM
jgi:hypothetical protein